MKLRLEWRVEKMKRKLRRKCSAVFDARLLFNFELCLKTDIILTKTHSEFNRCFLYEIFLLVVNTVFQNNFRVVLWIFQLINTLTLYYNRYSLSGAYNWLPSGIMLQFGCQLLWSSIFKILLIFLQHLGVFRERKRHYTFLGAIMSPIPLRDEKCP